jgi:quercetin dioxygenase-like cupin family protein
MESAPTPHFKSRFTNARELTNGLKSEGLLTLEPLEQGPPEHIHLKQMEYFEVLTGALVVSVNGENKKLKVGERLEIQKGIKHTYFNETSEPMTAKFGYEPALNIEWLIDTMDSGERKNGGDWHKIPLLEQGFVLYYLREEYRLANLPFWLQDIVFGLLSKIAQFSGVSDKIKLPSGL